MNPRLAVVPELDTELDRLYSLPLEEFTAARNELASRLRKAGQGDAAEAVHALRKPSVAVWTVNQLARRHGDDVGALVAAGDELRRAQERALRGEGAERVRDATAAERAAVRGLTRLAERLLADEGRAATQQTLERVAATLRAAAVDPDAASLLQAGRLPDEVEASGFGALESLAPPTRPKKRKDDDAADLEARREHEQRLRALRKRVAQLERTALQAEAKAERAEHEAAETKAAAEAARRSANGARAELGAAEAAPPE